MISLYSILIVQVILYSLFIYFFISRIWYKYILKITGEKKESVDSEHGNKRKEL